MAARSPCAAARGAGGRQAVGKYVGADYSCAKAGLLQVLANRPLLEVASRLQACRCYLGNDSGITHLAALLGVPTIALFGPSDPAIWHPVGPAVKVIQERPLERLPVDTVMEAIEAFYKDT